MPGNGEQAERDLCKALARVEARLPRYGGQIDVQRFTTPQQLTQQRYANPSMPGIHKKSESNLLQDGGDNKQSSVAPHCTGLLSSALPPPLTFVKHKNPC